jgi:hypothetical protein
MDLGEIGWERVDWILLAQNGDQFWAVVNMVMNLKFFRLSPIFNESFDLL